MNARKPDPKLLPPFQEGEQLEVHRVVDGQRVIMFVQSSEASSLGPERMRLTARMASWGPSPHADGRVARQGESIKRLLAHLQEHCVNPDCEHLDKPTTEEPMRAAVPLGPMLIANTAEPQPNTVINWMGVNFVPAPLPTHVEADAEVIVSHVVGADPIDWGAEAPQQFTNPDGSGYQA